MNIVPTRTFAQKYHVKTIAWLTLFVLLVIGTAKMTGVDFVMFFANFGQFVVLLQQMEYTSLVVQPILETIQMALIGTTVGTLVAIPFSVLAARNIVKNKFLRGIIRFILNLVRTLPDLMLAALFVAIVGIGPVAGVFTLAIFSFGMISKLFYEAIETIDEGPLEALQAAGANKTQLVVFAVIPQVFNYFVSYFLYTFEINVRASTVLGYLGAGGIGVYLQRSLDQFAYGQTAIIILGILVVVLIIDGVSNTLRERLL
ncbi:MULTISPECIES: phosphonate ABC transporter, permease protein PhnE [Pediococcus]|uniref:phosphonate ABC transporter, permease protein PhnE n=1 Tax=Pediococcus TaxID=1253 RepID=UPI000E884913|nr:MULTISPECIES: phosphonate ABC transporter, permease protein PhnE [Pediococcus]MCT3029814.1 phosphonate ABC transporter, permease protein PhnE [Pediococcus parvulus]HBO47164.1 phosphonate ABC transporter, permease protein PhnE [Pediococcus sp.]